MKQAIPKKILIIDDSAFDRGMISVAMKDVCSDLRCLELSSGVTALETIRTEMPDLTIVDIRMPELSGWDIIKHVQDDEGLRDHKVVVMSGSRSDLDIEKASKIGAHGYYTKPDSKVGYRRIAEELKLKFLD